MSSLFILHFLTQILSGEEGRTHLSSDTQWQLASITGFNHFKVPSQCENLKGAERIFHTVIMTAPILVRSGPDGECVCVADAECVLSSSNVREIDSQSQNFGTMCARLFLYLPPLGFQ